VIELPDDFRDMLVELCDAGADFVVVGGHAVAFHGHPRATKDLGVLVRATPDNAAKVYLALAAYGAPLAAFEVTEADFASYDGVLQIGVPPLRIDILTRADGISYDEAADGAPSFELEGRRVPVMTREALLKNKRAVGRAQDVADVEALERFSSDPGARALSLRSNQNGTSRRTLDRRLLGRRASAWSHCLGGGFGLLRFPGRARRRRLGAAAMAALCAVFGWEGGTNSTSRSDRLAAAPPRARLPRWPAGAAVKNLTSAMITSSWTSSAHRQRRAPGHARHFSALPFQRVRRIGRDGILLLARAQRDAAPELGFVVLLRLELDGLELDRLVLRRRGQCRGRHVSAVRLR
jgi:hypothetical protein